MSENNDLGISLIDNVIVTKKKKILNIKLRI